MPVGNGVGSRSDVLGAESQGAKTADRMVMRMPVELQVRYHHVRSWPTPCKTAPCSAGPGPSSPRRDLQGSKLMIAITVAGADHD